MTNQMLIYCLPPEPVLQQLGRLGLQQSRHLPLQSRRKEVTTDHNDGPRRIAEGLRTCHPGGESGSSAPSCHMVCTWAVLRLSCYASFNDDYKAIQAVNRHETPLLATPGAKCRDQSVRGAFNKLNVAAGLGSHNPFLAMAQSGGLFSRILQPCTVPKCNTLSVCCKRLKSAHSGTTRFLVLVKTLFLASIVQQHQQHFTIASLPS